MNFKIIFSVLLIIIASAIGHSEVVNVPILDIAKGYPEKIMNIKKEVGTVEYVPLETNEKSLIKNIDGLAINDSYIIVTDLGSNQVLIFNREGKFISKISQKGGGPEEYLLIRASSNYKRTLRINEKCWPDEMVNYDSNHLLVYAGNNPKPDNLGNIAVYASIPAEYMEKIDCEIMMLELKTGLATINTDSQTLLSKIIPLKK